MYLILHYLILSLGPGIMAEYTGNGYKDESVENKNALSSPQVRF